jgi:hypothetical protein
VPGRQEDSSQEDSRSRALAKQLSLRPPLGFHTTSSVQGHLCFSGWDGRIGDRERQGPAARQQLCKVPLGGATGSQPAPGTAPLPVALQ